MRRPQGGGFCGDSVAILDIVNNFVGSSRVDSRCLVFARHNACCLEVLTLGLEKVFS